MKRKMLILCIITMCLVSAKTTPERLVRLTVVNKSELAVELSLNGVENEDTFYYLRVPEGGQQLPSEQVFTVLPDTYTSQLHYVELWDPVYGYSCDSKSQRMEITRNTKLVVLACDRTPANAGEPPATIKYSAPATHKKAR